MAWMKVMMLFITSVTSRSEPYTVTEIEVLLLAQEERLEKHRRTAEIQANAAQQQSFSKEKKNQNQSFGAGYNQNNFFRAGYNPRFQDRGGYSRGGNPQCRGFGERFGARSGQRSSQDRSQIDQFHIECQVCGKNGLEAWYCYHRYDQNYNGPNDGQSSTGRSINPSATAMLATPETVFNPTWYPDSGASARLTPDPANLQSMSPYDGNSRVMIGNGTGLGYQGESSARET